jgi:hypothetical protein
LSRRDDREKLDFRHKPAKYCKALQQVLGVAFHLNGGSLDNLASAEYPFAPALIVG